MHTLFALILKPKNIIFVIFFPMKANQKAFAYDFTGVKHGFHHLKHD